MRPDDSHNDRQTQTGTLATDAFTPPEALEDVRPILDSDARTAVLDADRAVRVNLNDHLGSPPVCTSAFSIRLRNASAIAAALPVTRTG